MYFKKLEIFGFKSFADKTVLNFEPGITAIVGPNGCGKSNVFDSIRWVLGEQSVKELRGSSMEDVIFNGTQSKPSLGFAEVSLTFSNEQRVLPIEYDEVTITRRLFRSGESEYLLNKTAVRLKDIQELLMGTGIGAEAYSLVQQGKVDLVVSARPEERRQIFDEAAGITKYKTKKREALSKLKSTEDNLLRVNDIVIEVKRQIASMERQANKARKYKDEYEKLKKYEIGYAQYEINEFSVKRKKTLEEMDAMMAEEKELSSQHEDMTARLTNEINYLGELEQKMNEINTEKIKLDGQMDLYNRQIGFNQERMASLDNNEQRLTGQKRQLVERCRLQQEKIEKTKQTIRMIEETLQGNEEKIKQKRESLKILERSMAESKDKIREDEEKIFILTSRQVHKRNELTDIMKDVQGFLARRRRLEIEDTKVISEKNDIDQKLKNIECQIHSVQETMAELEDTKEKKGLELHQLRANMVQLEQEIDELEKRKVFFKSQKELIEKLNSQYDDIPDPVSEGKFITEKPPLEHHTGIIGKVKGVRPIEENRGLFFPEREVKELFEIICETKFIELDPQQILLKMEDISGQIKDLSSRKEDLGKEIGEAGRRLGQLEQEIHNKEKAHSIFKSQRNDIAEEVQKLTNELEVVSLELEEVKVAMEGAKKKEDEANYQLDTINQDITWCQNDIKDKQATISVKIQENQQITVTMAQLETELLSARENLENYKQNHQALSEDLDSCLEEIKKIEDELSGYDIKRQEFKNEIEQLNVVIEQTFKKKEALRIQFQEYESQKMGLGDQINSMRSRITETEEKIDDLKQKMHGYELDRQKASFNEQTIKDRLLQAYKIDFDHLPEEFLRQGGDQFQFVLSQEGVDPASADSLQMSLEQMTQEIDRLRKRCESFGSVNLVAIEEYEDLKGRFEFLTKQQSDLLEAKSHLMSTINKINRSIKQMFMDTFTRVGEEFRIYFRMLFGGGEAQLMLLDPENVLESGIEIIARPPGKKLQSISLLSGGEKTLTAIALIFGVFKVNPSPFCVLDEIDAALDEANVGRFSYLLQDFAKIVQFIIITHNKKTISSADVMYGITMPETGISKIVSVKLSEQEKSPKEEMAVAA